MRGFRPFPFRMRADPAARSRFSRLSAKNSLARAPVSSRLMMIAVSLAPLKPEPQEVVDLLPVELYGSSGQSLRSAVDKKRLDQNWQIILLGKYDSPLVLRFWSRHGGLLCLEAAILGMKPTLKLCAEGEIRTRDQGLMSPLLYH